MNHCRTWLLGLLCLLILFANLGGAALFEPDEGRNAEKAREILLLKDWVTPHENFLPVLDKPIFFYWLIALSYKVFGISEWSARLPSTMAALGCLLLVYSFARKHWGLWVALWSMLILLTSIEFFVLARIVIADMTLTFFVTLALSSFYSAVHVENEKARKLYCLLMYGALGAGTLVKGLIGLFIPGVVFFFYLLFRKKWSAWRRLYLLPGALLYLAIVAPWYLWVDARNPGYLRYYFWDEHFTRYLTGEFNRTKSWYYFFLVVAIGFLPWTIHLPFVVRNLWKKLDDKVLFLILWVILPFTFFSASNSKLPHYVLPIYPALAILLGQTAVEFFGESRSKSRWILYLPWALTAGFVLYLLVGGMWRHLLPSEIRTAVSDHLSLVAACAALMALIYGSFAYANVRGSWKGQGAAYLCACVSIALSLLLAGQLIPAASLRRSARTLAENSAAFVTHDSQVVLYDTYITGMPFYLRLDRPIWVVLPEGKITLMGSPYVSTHLPEPAPGYGEVLFTFAEFAQAWKKTKKPLLVFAKAKNIARLEVQVGDVTQELARANEYVLVSKP